MDVPQPLFAVQPGEVGRRLLQRVHSQHRRVCGETVSSVLRQAPGAVRYGSGFCSVTCLTLSVRSEPSRRYLTAGRQQQRSAFVHDGSVSQNGLEGFVQNAERLLRNPQHQLHKQTQQNKLRRSSSRTSGASSLPVLLRSIFISGQSDVLIRHTCFL